MPSEYLRTIAKLPESCRQPLAWTPNEQIPEAFKEVQGNEQLLQTAFEIVRRRRAGRWSQ